MFIVFMALAIGPVVANTQINGFLKKISLPFNLMQPVGQDNNDTRNRNATGTGVGAAAATATTGGGGAATPSPKLVKLF
jgi:1,3-beta-glucan synthase